MGLALNFPRQEWSEPKSSRFDGMEALEALVVETSRVLKLIYRQRWLNRCGHRVTPDAALPQRSA